MVIAHTTPVMAHTTMVIAHTTPVIAHTTPVIAHTMLVIAHTTLVIAHTTLVIAHTTHHAGHAHTNISDHSLRGHSVSHHHTAQQRSPGDDVMGSWPTWLKMADDDAPGKGGDWEIKGRSLHEPSRLAVVPACAGGTHGMSAVGQLA